MKPNQLATIVLRLLGVYCLVEVIPLFSFVPTAIAFVQSESVDGRGNLAATAAILAATVLPVAFKLLAGVLLLAFSTKWGDRLAQPFSAGENTTAISFEQAQALAFAVAGVLIFADTLPQLFHSLSRLANWALAGRNDWQSQKGYRIYSFQEATASVGIIAKAALGLVLFFRARGFANFWRSLRSFGTPKPPQG
jgi:hypothetical protein